MGHIYDWNDLIFPSSPAVTTILCWKWWATSWCRAEMTNLVQKAEWAYDIWSMSTRQGHAWFLNKCPRLVISELDKIELFLAIDFQLSFGSLGEHMIPVTSHSSNCPASGSWDNVNNIFASYFLSEISKVNRCRLLHTSLGSCDYLIHRELFIVRKSKNVHVGQKSSMVYWRPMVDSLIKCIFFLQYLCIKEVDEAVCGAR